MKLASLSIVIPCFNSQSTVSRVIDDAYKEGGNVANKLEIVVLDDGSTDNSFHILKQYKKRVSMLRILRHQKNQGYGKTIKELYANAKYSWIFSLPSDGQFTAREIRKLIPFTHTTDMILGLREHRNDSWKRKLQSTLYNWLLRVLFHTRLHDANTIRLMKASRIHALHLLSESAFVDAELAILLAKSGGSIREIPINHEKRTDAGGSGGKFFATILPTIIDMIRMLRRQS